MRRALSLSLPRFAVDRERRLSRRAVCGRPSDPPEAGEPALLLEASGHPSTRGRGGRSLRAGGARLVVACDDEARRSGVRPGQTVAEARARLPGHGVVVLPHDAARDAAALCALASWAGRFSPSVAIDPPAGLFLDVTGCERLFGGEDRLVDLLLGGLARLGFAARAAVAGTFGAAWALARFARETPVRIAEGAERAAIAPLPVACLRLPSETVHALGEVGVVRVEHLLALPRESLDARFGEGLLRRLDQATGRAPEALRIHRPRAPVAVERAFEGPVSDPVALRIALRLLVEGLARTLAGDGRGVLRLEVEAARPEGPPLLETVRFARATADARHLAAVLDPRLERWHLEPGVDRLRLVAARSRRLRVEQERAFGLPSPEEGGGEEAADRAAAETVDALASRCGERAVLGFDLVESHVPERAFRARAPLVPPSAGDRAAATPSPRPSVLYDPPEPAEVVALVPDGPPARLRWRAETRLVRHARGPERLARPWWGEGGGPERAERDYFRVEDERGRWLWIFRDSVSRRWFVHGEWA